jgi:hypothetical protein
MTSIIKFFLLIFPVKTFVKCTFSLGHTGADGSSINDRLCRYGKWLNAIGENIDFGNSSAIEIVISLIVDDGGSFLIQIDLLLG